MIIPNDLLIELHSHLTPDERAALLAVHRDDGTSLLDLISSWTWKVRSMSDQLGRTMTGPGPKLWNTDDLAGALFDRDSVEDLLARTPDPTAGSARRVLAESDAEYQSMTVLDPKKEMIRIGGVEVDRAGWWWLRVPDRGPIRDEIDIIRIGPLTGIEIRSRFNDEELAALESITLTKPTWTRPFPLLGALSTWGSAIRRITRQMSDAPPLPIVHIWGVRDLIRVCNNRDVVQQLLPDIPEALAPTVRTLLDGFDDEYRAVTTEDPSAPILREMSTPRPPEFWWWYRVPKAGPIRAELDG